jgi:aspartate/methionine/tyrosine aminotransferase
MSYLDVGGRNWEELTNDPSVIHMGHNCNYLPVDPSINQAMIEAISSNRYRNYPAPYGIEQLRELIRADVRGGKTEVLVTNGSTEAIYQVMSVVLKPGDEMITSDPAWPHIRNFGVSLGATVIEVPIYDRQCGLKLTPQAIEERTTGNTRVIAIIDPLNPLGSAYSEQEIQAICAIAARRGIYVLHDSTYRDFHPAHYPALRCYDRSIVTISLSKSCGFAGLRLGAAIMRPDMFERVLEHQISRLGVNGIVQLGAIAAYETKSTWIARMFETNQRHQTLLKEALDTVCGVSTLVYPSFGNFLAADVGGAGIDAEQVVRVALGAGFVIRSGAYTSRAFGNQFIRVTTTVPMDDVVRFCAEFPAAMARQAPSSDGETVAQIPRRQQAR